MNLRLHFDVPSVLALANHPTSRPDTHGTRTDDVPPSLHLRLQRDEGGVGVHLVADGSPCPPHPTGGLAPYLIEGSDPGLPDTVRLRLLDRPARLLDLLRAGAEAGFPTLQIDVTDTATTIAVARRRHRTTLPAA